MKRILNNISKITLALKGEGRGVGLLLMCICAVLPQTAQAQFDLTITKHGEHAATLSKQAATSITLEYNSGNVTVTARQGDGDASPATANLAHNLRYDFELISMSSGDGSDLPDGDFPAQVKRRNQAAPTYTYPTLVLVGTGTHTYTLTPSATSITLAMSGGKYVVDGNVLADKVTDIYLVSTHAAVTDAAVAATCSATGLTEGSHCSVCNEVLVAQQTVPATGNHVCYDNGFCTVCGDQESATKVTDSNYTTLGLTASHVGYYAIANAGQLYWFSKDPSGKSAVLTKDIVVNEDVLTEDRTLRGDGSNFRQWYGFDLSQNCTFDGNGHTISGLYCKGESYAGVINTNNGTIKILGVKYSYFSASANVGGVCAYNYGTIQDSYATNVTTANGYYVGGVCGYNAATIQNCYATNVTANGGYAGGVCGRNNTDNTIIKNCYTDHKYLIGIYKGDHVSGGVSQTDFASGRICWLLNGTVDDDGNWTAGTTSGEQAWYQNLDNDENADGYPVLDKNHAKVRLMNGQLANQQITVPLSKVGSAYLTSVYVDFPCTIEGVDAYTAQEPVDGMMKMNQVDGVIAAGTGLVLIGDQKANATLIWSDDTSDYEDKGVLKGRTETFTATDGQYAFSLDANGFAGFYNWADREIAAYKAYYEGAANAKGFRMVFEDETTSIHNSQFIMHNDVDAVYNLNGQRLSAPQKGINIINGKKVLVK